MFLAIKLYDIAMYNSETKEVLSGQYTRKIDVTSRGGFIYSSDGELLSHKEAGAVALVNTSVDSDKNEIFRFLSDFSDIDDDDIINKINKHTPFSLTLKCVPDEKSIKDVFVYPLYEEENSICRHIIGYKDVDGVGCDGIYKKFGSVLDIMGGSLSYRYLANARGKGLENTSFVIENACFTDKSGIILTIDKEIQSNVDEICNKYMDMGAVVVSDIETGKLLAVSSRPLYDTENLADSLASDRGDFINRAFSLYTPGSVFKTVTAAAALDYDITLENYEYECTGECDVSGKTFKCHNEKGHGLINLEKAYANSCNTYFINLAEKIGFETLLYMAEKMGLGKPHLIDGFYVKGANMPSLSETYPPAYKANISFGQGDLLVSPIDVLNIFSICSSGYTTDFSLVYGIYNGKQENETVFKSNTRKSILSDEVVNKLIKMMRACVTQGTGIQAQAKNVNTGGKTATAQSGQYKNATELLHTWFAGVFPIEAPKYAIVVLCDGNGNNTTSCAKIFSKIVETIQAK